MTLIEKAGLLDKYIRVLKWLKGSSKFKFPIPEVRLPGPDSRPAAAQVVAAAAAAAAASPELTYNGPLFKLNYKVSKDMSLKVLRRRLTVLDKFRQCIVCGHICQKKTESGWEVVWDKHTAAQWLGTGSTPFPDCANQTLSPEEKAVQVKMHGRKVWRMKERVKRLMKRRVNEEKQIK